MNEKEKINEKQLQKIETIKTVHSSVSNTQGNSQKNLTKISNNNLNQIYNNDMNLDNYDYDEDLLHSQLFENHEKEIFNYEYSNINAKLRQIYFFPSFVQTKSKPECFTVRYDKSDTYIAGGYSTGHIVVYEASTGSYVKHMLTSDYPISSIRWKLSGNKPILNAVHSDGKVSQWYANAGKVLYTFQEKDNFIMCMDYDLKGTIFATGGSDNKIRLYDDETKSIIHTIAGNWDHVSHSNRIFSVCFGKTKNYESVLVSGGWDNTVKFFDVRQKKIVGSLFGPHIVGDTIDLKGHYVLTGSTDIRDQIKIWDLRNYKLVEAVKFEPDHGDDKFYVTNINCAQFSKAYESYDSSKFFNTFACGGQKKNQIRVFADDPGLVDKNKYLSLYDEERTLTKKESNGEMIDDLMNKKMPLAKVDNISECIYSLDYMNTSNTLAYGSGLGCIYSLNLVNK